MTRLFDEIDRRTIAQSIVDQVRGLISQGRLKPGERLPSERDLCEQLGVGRSSVREATSAMLALGMIEIRPGEGAFVRSDYPQSTLECVDWPSLMLSQQSSDLFEARVAIEVTTARLAALRATPEDQERLSSIVDRMAQAATLEEFIALDVDFHLALAKASGNPILGDIIGRMQDLLPGSMQQVLQVKELRQAALEQHRSLCRAIAERSAAGAEQVMRAHLQKHLPGLEGSQDGPAGR